MRFIVLAVFLVAIWLLWSGYLITLILVFGALSVLLVLWLSGRMYVSPARPAPMSMGLRLIPYIPWLLWQIVLSNISVGRAVLQRKLAITPTLVTLPASQLSDVGQVLYANSITLTPGTVSMQVEDDEILVHALSESDALSLREGGMDRRVTAVEGMRGRSKG